MFGRAVGKQRSRAFMFAVGAFGLVLAAFTFYIGYEAAYSVPGRGYYNLHAQFANAENLANHYEIREGGVRVGQVLNPRVRNGKALVDMRLSDKYKPLLSDTRLAVRLRSAVGVRYLEIIPGEHGTPLPEGATIPASHAKPIVALDKVLNTFDSKTRARTRTLLDEMGVGTMSRGTDINEAIASAPGFTGSLRTLAKEINGRPGAMSGFVDASDRAAQTFDAPTKDAIATGFKPERQALVPFVDRRGQVQATLQAAAPALAAVRDTTPTIGRFAATLASAAHDVRPTLQEMPPSLRSASRLLQSGGTPLKLARSTLTRLSSTTQPVLDLLHQVKPALAPVDRALGDLLPTLTYAAPRSCDLTQAATGWAEYTKWGDTYNSFIRFLLPAVRGDEPGSQTPETQKVAPLNQFVNPDPYPGPCVNGVGVTGFAQPTEQESQKGLFYSATNHPGG